MQTHEDHVARAIKRYHRAAKDGCGGGFRVPEPDAATSGEVDVGGVRYVVLRNVAGVLAVYSVTRADRLTRVEHWPEAVAEVGKSGV